jgi:multidrug efflux system membrane fusion protein
MKAIHISFMVITLLLTGCKTEVRTTTTSSAIKVRVINIATEALSIPVHSSGTVTSSEEMKLSFKIGGVIAKVHVKEGDKVSKGNLLAALNLAEIDAKVYQAKNGYEKAKRDYDRAKNLYRDSVATLEQMQNSVTALNVAKADLDIASFNLLYSKIVAPDDGLILKQVAKENELIAPGYPVFLFGTNGKSWKVKTGVSDRDVVRISTGDSAVVTMDVYPGIKFSAVVNQVGEMSDPMTGTYEIELLINDAGYRLASGFVADIEMFPVKKESYSLVPVESIIGADGSRGYVYTVTDSGRAKKISIEIGTIFGAKAAITNGLEGISAIVSEGAAYLKDGEPVEIIK